MPKPLIQSFGCTDWGSPKLDENMTGLECFFCKTNKGDGEVFQMLGKVGNVRAKTSMKKHLFEASFIFFF